MSDFSITVVDVVSGRTEVLPLDPNTSIQDVIGFCQALFGLGNDIRLLKNGKALPTSATLSSAGTLLLFFLVAVNVRARVGSRPSLPCCFCSPARFVSFRQELSVETCWLRKSHRRRRLLVLPPHQRPQVVEDSTFPTSWRRHHRQRLVARDHRSLFTILACRSTMP